jgi:hypothetical protein
MCPEGAFQEERQPNPLVLITQTMTVDVVVAS